jgi:hypothetical protein
VATVLGVAAIAAGAGFGVSVCVTVFFSVVLHAEINKALTTTRLRYLKFFMSISLRLFTFLHH